MNNVLWRVYKAQSSKRIFILEIAPHNHKLYYSPRIIAEACWGRMFVFESSKKVPFRLFIITTIILITLLFSVVGIHNRSEQSLKDQSYLTVHKNLFALSFYLRSHVENIVFKREDNLVDAIESIFFQTKKLFRKNGVHSKDIDELYEKWQRIKVIKDDNKKLIMENSQLVTDILFLMQNVIARTHTELYNQNQSTSIDILSNILPAIIENIGVVRREVLYSEIISAENKSEDDAYRFREVGKVNEVINLLRMRLEEAIDKANYNTISMTIKDKIFNVDGRLKDTMSSVTDCTRRVDTYCPRIYFLKNFSDSSAIYHNIYKDIVYEQLADLQHMVSEHKRDEIIIIPILIISIILFLYSLLLLRKEGHDFGSYGFFDKISFSRKVILFSVSMVIVTSLFISIIILIYGIKWIDDTRDSHIRRDLLHSEMSLRKTLGNLSKEVKFLAGTPYVKVIANNKNPTEDMLTKSAKEGLENVFINLLKTESDFTQARYIDVKAGGIERVRADKIKNDVVVTKGNLLQNKSHRDYYQQAIKAIPGELYVSQINLNKEHNKISQPKDIVVRAIVPVVDGKSEISGLVAVNMSLSHIFKELTKFFSGDGTLYITNSEGEYLYGAGEERNMAFEYGKSARIQNDYPQLNTLFEGIGSLDNSGIFKEGDKNFYTRKVAINEGNDNKFILLAYQPFERNIIFSNIGITLYISVFVVLVSLISILLGRYIAESITSPIKKVIWAIERFGEGEFSAELPVKSRDEIGLLARAFIAMGMSVQNSNNQLKYSEERLRGILENTVDGIITIDHKGIVQNYNRACEKMLGYQAEEVIGQNIKMLMPEYHAIKHDNYIKDYLRTGEKKTIGISREVEAKRKDGSTFPIKLSVADTKIGDEHIFTGILRDITEEKMNERILKHAITEAQESAQAKSSFLANMSHELRTPLNGIVGAAELVLREKLTPKQKEYIDIIKGSGATLLALIGDILDFSKIEAGEMRLENIPFNLRESFETSAEILGINAAEKGLDLILDYPLDVPCCVVGDQVRVSQIIFNLVGNAIKFTKEGHISIKVRNGEVRLNKVEFEISIEDTGIGMEQDKISKIFDKFTQEDASITRQFGGTGLGLSISKQLIELMNGKIDVKSVKGEGTTFTYTMRMMPDSQKDEREMLPNIDLKDAKILLASDDLITSEIIKDILKFEAVEISHVTTAKDLYNKLNQEIDRKSSWGIVLIDFSDKYLDEALEVVSDKKYSDSSFIRLASSFHCRNYELLLENGFCAHIHKPIRVNDFMAIINLVYHKDHQIKGVVSRTDILNNEGLANKKHMFHIKALLAEDNLVNKQIISRILENIGCELECVDNGKQALDYVKEGKEVDIVFMDCQMPVMDGITASSEIRKLKDIKQPIIIALTANVFSGDKEKCFDAGMDDFVTKPVDFDLLDKVLLKWVDKEKITEGEIKEPEEENMEDSQDAALSEMQTIDEEVIKSLREMLGGDVSTMLQVYVNTTNGLIKEMQEFLKKGNVKEVGRHAHSLKSSSGQVGAMKLSELAKELEHKIRHEQSYDNLEDLYAQIVEEFKVVEASLHHHIN